jgi:putative membrane protein
MGITMSLLASTLLPLADGFDMHGDFGSGWWVVMMVGMLIFWGLVIVGAVWLVREFMHGRETSGPDTPLALLDRRFAAGEISAEEYRERKAVLTGESPPP